MTLSVISGKGIDVGRSDSLENSNDDPLELIDQCKSFIDRDIRTLRTLIDTDPLYPKVSVDKILDRIAIGYKEIQNMRAKSIDSLAPGRWIQIFDGDRTAPLYAKVKGDHPDSPLHLVCEGVFTNHGGTKMARSFNKKLCMGVSDEVGRALEFANKLNTLKPGL